MIIRLENGKFTIISDQERKANREAFEVKKGNNGKNYVTRESVPCNLLNVSEGNSKTGEHCVNFNFSIEYTCSHCCECYLLAKCYAETGCYLFADNQAKYTENVNFYNNVTSDEFIKALQLAIDTFKYKLFRYFTCGDIPNYRFVDIMVTLAKNNPDINFWSYTKKYEIVNNWIDKNGDLPENLTIIFSHWLNDDGTYYPMNNRHNLPTSEFIPLGKEYLTETVDFICPCSDPSIKATCETCDHPCYKLQKGQKQALLEHSTKETKIRDKMIREAKKAIKQKEDHTMKKLIKVENGRYMVIDETGTTIALVYRYGKGYTRDIRNAQTGEFFKPAYFNYFKTLSEVKKRYDIK